MSRFVGHWSWAFLPRRAAFSCFSAVYRFIETAGRRSFTVWPSVERELRWAVGLAPLLYAKLDAPWFPKVMASDASETGQGVVAATCPLDHLEKLARAPLQLRDGEPADRSLHPLLKEKEWKVIVASAFKREEHINVLEARALTTAVKWALSSPKGRGSRLLVQVDSLVVMFAARKGRSSAFQLLKRLRCLNALLLCSGSYLAVNWIPTEVNPADGPSRRYEFDSTLGFPGEGPGRSFLQKAAHKPATRERYVNALRRFVSWGFDHGVVCVSVEDLDRALAEFFNDLYLDLGGGGRSIACSAMSGLHLFLPQSKGKLHVSALALRGWARLRPTISRPPLSWELAVAVAVRLGCAGRWSSGVAVLLAFDCYLRIGALCSLVKADVVMDADARMGSAQRGMALCLRRVKNGTNKWAAVRSRVVQDLLMKLVEGLPTDDSRLFPSASRFYKYFKVACADLGLSEDYVPHSLRHGGATHDYMRGVPLEDILHLGRWASIKTARIYVQQGRALLLACRVPDRVRILAKTLASDVSAAMALAQQ